MKIKLSDKAKTVRTESEFTVKGDTATLTLLTEKRIKTLEELVSASQIDTSIWEVERFTVNKWEVAGKTNDDKFIVQDLWQVKATLKKKNEEIALRLIGEEIINAIKKISPRIKRKAYKKSKEPCLAEIDFFDVHFGKLAWGMESGENYDLKIARKRYMAALVDMVHKLRPYRIEKFLFPIGNDFFNVNSSDGQTFGGTPQSEDDRWKKRSLRVGV